MEPHKICQEVFMHSLNYLLHHQKLDLIINIFNERKTPPNQQGSIF